MINEQVLKGNWDQLKGKIQQKWGQLTDDDLRAVSGGATQLIGVIERKTGVARDKIEKYIDELSAEGSSMMGKAVGSARDYARHASETVQDTAESASHALRSGYDEAQTAVQKNPGTAVLAAFGIGLVAGCILTCQMRR